MNVIGSTMGASDGEEGRSGASLDDIFFFFGGGRALEGGGDWLVVVRRARMLCWILAVISRFLPRLVCNERDNCESICLWLIDSDGGGGGVDVLSGQMTPQQMTQQP